MSYNNVNGSLQPPVIPRAVVSSTGKTRLQAALEDARTKGKPALGQWITFPGYMYAKTVASQGTDWVLVDCEHGHIDDSAMYHSIAAIVSAGASPIVRIPGCESWMIKRVLDAGAHGVMVPMVETKEQAELVASASRYRDTCQYGSRGCGAFWAASNFDLNPVDYQKHANNIITVFVQIESSLGVQNAEAIAAVPGIDGLFVGPNDLACSMGYFPFHYKNIKEVQDATDLVLKAAQKHQKSAGYFCMSAEDVAAKYQEGWDFLNCGADILALVSWTRNEIAKVKTLLDTPTKKNLE